MTPEISVSPIPIRRNPLSFCKHQARSWGRKAGLRAPASELLPQKWPSSPLELTIFAPHCDHFRPSKWPLWDEMCSRNIESAIQDFFDTYLFGIVRAKIYENPHSIWAPYHILTDKTLGSAYARACPNFFSPLEASSSLPCPSLPQNELFMKLMLTWVRWIIIHWKYGN